MIQMEYLSKIGEQLQSTLAHAALTLGKLEQFEHASSKEIPSEEELFLEEQFKNSLSSIRVMILFSMELLGLQTLISYFETDIKKLPSQIKDRSILPYVGVLISEELSLYYRYSRPLTALSSESGTRELDQNYLLLDRILRGTPKLIYDRNVIPQNEKEVRREIYAILLHIFPDTVREIPIAKVASHYKPDFGIRSLRTAIEYKFADSEPEMRKAITGIYEDISAYSGTSDWTRYIAVIYQTDLFFTEAQIIEEFKLSGMPHSWKPIIVVGRGGRPQRTSGSKKAAKRKAQKKPT